MEVLQRTANRGSISTGPYEVDNSVKLETANNEWFYNASPTAGNRRTYTFSFWIKRTALGTVNASGNQYVIGQGQHGRMFFGSDYFQYRFDDGHDCRNVSRQFRDTSAWYHFVVAVDTNQSSAANRVKLYVNGESLAVDDHDGGSFPDIQDQGAFFSTSYLTLGTAPFGGSFNVGDGDYDISCYLAEFCAVDGQQLAPTDFGEFDSDSGIWKPIDVSGINFGSQGYYLKFTNASNLGEDFSGNDNDFALSNLAAADQATDTPTNNFCILNPIFRGKQAGSPVISDGGSKHNGSGGWDGIHGTMGFNKGKWYWEAKTQSGNHSDFMYGIQTADAEVNTNTSAHNLLSTAVWYVGGAFWIKDSTSGRDDVAAGSITHTTGSSVVYGIALNMDDGEVTYYANGSVVSGLNGIDIDGLDGLLVMPMVSFYNVGFSMNFGGYSYHSISSAATDANGYGTFEYAPPSGYYALCTKNLEEYG